MTMPWSRYPKIAESSASFTDRTGGQWVCTEKVHGANFSVMATADGFVNFASRSGILAHNDNFFGFKSQGLDAYLNGRVLALREALVQDGTAQEHDSILVYGELYGGHYPHPDVAAVAGVGPIQRGVWYAPSISFMAFDVALASAEDGATTYLSFDIARTASQGVGLCFAEALFRGTLAQCMGHKVRFSSTIPATLGLPALKEPNLAEGLVVRPAIEPSAAQRAGGRGLVKRKIPEFSEKQYQNGTWRDARQGTSAGGTACRGGSGMNWADREAVLRYEMLAAVNQQRLDSVASKTGRVDPADRAACRQLLNDFLFDVAEALVEDGLLRQPADFETEHVVLRRECEAEAKPLLARFIRGNQSSARGSLMTPARLAEPATHAPGPAGAPLALASARELLVPIDADRPPLGARTLPCMTARS